MHTYKGITKFLTFLIFFLCCISLYIVLDVSDTWSWRISSSLLHFLHTLLLFIWYIPTGLLYKFNVFDSAKAKAVSLKILLITVGYLPAFYGMHFLHRILRNRIYPHLGVRSQGWISMDNNPAFFISVNAIYTRITWLLIILWIAIPAICTRGNVSRAKAVLLINIAPTLAFIHFVVRYFLIQEQLDINLSIGSWGGVCLSDGAWWSTIDPLNFFELFARLAIRLFPNSVIALNVLVLCFICYLFLITLSIIGSFVGSKLRKE